jgi:hypothetical protein
MITRVSQLLLATFLALGLCVSLWVFAARQSTHAMNDRIMARHLSSMPSAAKAAPQATTLFSPTTIFGINVLGSASLTPNGQMIANAGARWAQIGVSWSQLAPFSTTTTSAYNWNDSDVMLSTAYSQGLTAIVVLGGNPCWAAEFSRGPVNRVPITRWVEYVEAVVQRYSIAPYYVRYWSIYNEPDAADFESTTPDCLGTTGTRRAFGDHPDQYVQTFQLARDKIKQVDTNAVVLMGGIALDAFADEGGFFNRNFLTNVITLGVGAYFDAMNFHYYPEFEERWSGLNGKANFIRSVLQRYGVNTPLICSELGSSSQLNGQTEELQSRDVVKLYARTLAAELKVGIWYNLNDYSSSSDPFRFHGLVRTDNSAKPALSAYQTTASRLNSLRYQRTLAATEGGTTNLEGYVFTNQSAPLTLYVIWTRDDLTQTFTLPVGVTSITDKYDAPRAYTTIVAVSGDPLFVTIIQYPVFLPLLIR